MTNSQFHLIAPHYDELMAGVPYHMWVDYVEEILAKFDYQPKTVLDVACGTGNVTEIFASRGYEMVGVDIAPDMIEVAKSKKSGIEYYVQDIAEMELGRKFDLAISLFDSLNYVIDVNQLARGIKRVGQHLVKGGLFIFDVNTIYALAHHFFDQANLAPDRWPHYIWKSEFDYGTRICKVDMLFEVKNPDGSITQFKELHIQRGHTLEELTQMLVEAGFEVVEVYHAYKFRKPTRRSDRVFFVARKMSDE